MLTIITKVFGNKGKFLFQRSYPLRHPKKKSLSHPLFPPKSIPNVGGLTGLQSLSSFRHLLESVSPGLHSQAPTGHHWQAAGDCWHAPCPGEEKNQLTFCFLVLQFLKSSPRILCMPKAIGTSRLPTSEGQCWPWLLLPLFQPCV